MSGRFSIRTRLKSFGYAICGIREFFTTQLNAYLHLTLVIAVVAVGFLLHISRVEWLAIAISCGMVLSTEAMNTAVEYLCDFVSPEHHKKIKKVKDLAAGAVMLAAIAAFAVGLLIFVPKIIALC